MKQIVYLIALLCPGLVAAMTIPQLSPPGVSAQMVAEMEQKIHSVAGIVMSEQLKAQLAQQIEQIHGSEAKMQKVALRLEDLRQNLLDYFFGGTYLGCVKTSGAFTLGAATGVGGTGLVCYDWSNSSVYFIGGLDISIVARETPSGIGWAVGGGVVRVNGSSIEGTYLCGNLGVAAGWLGGQGMYCSEQREDQLAVPKHDGNTLVFLGYQGGAILQVGASYIIVKKLLYW